MALRRCNSNINRKPILGNPYAGEAAEADGLVRFFVAIYYLGSVHARRRGDWVEGGAGGWDWLDLWLGMVFWLGLEE